MLLMPNKKKAATVILASIHKDKPHVQQLGEESDTGEYEVPEDDEAMMGPEAAMDALLKAIETKDRKGMASALQDFLSMCGSEEADGGEE